MNRSLALDEMYTHARDALLLAGILEGDIYYDNVAREEGQQIPDRAFAQVYVRHHDAPQRGFGGPRTQRYRYVEKGTIWIKIHVPASNGIAHAAITQEVLSKYRTIRTSKISYVNIRAVEDGKHGLLYVTDFQATFSYDVFN